MLDFWIRCRKAVQLGIGLNKDPNHSSPPPPPTPPLSDPKSPKGPEAPEGWADFEPVLGTGEQEALSSEAAVRSFGPQSLGRFRGAKFTAQYHASGCEAFVWGTILVAGSPVVPFLFCRFKVPLSKKGTLIEVWLLGYQVM